MSQKSRNSWTAASQPTQPSANKSHRLSSSSFQNPAAASPEQSARWPRDVSTGETARGPRPAGDAGAQQPCALPGHRGRRVSGPRRPPLLPLLLRLPAPHASAARRRLAAAEHTWAQGRPEAAQSPACHLLRYLASSPCMAAATTAERPAGYFRGRGSSALTQSHHTREAGQARQRPRCGYHGEAVAPPTAAVPNCRTERPSVPLPGPSEAHAPSPQNPDAQA